MAAHFVSVIEGKKSSLKMKLPCQKIPEKQGQLTLNYSEIRISFNF